MPEAYMRFLSLQEQEDARQRRDLWRIVLSIGLTVMGNPDIFSTWGGLEIIWVTVGEENLRWFVHLFVDDSENDRQESILRDTRYKQRWNYSQYAQEDIP
jgi:hypothetical protein